MSTVVECQAARKERRFFFHLDIHYSHRHIVIISVFSRSSTSDSASFFEFCLTQSLFLLAAVARRRAAELFTKKITQRREKEAVEKVKHIEYGSNLYPSHIFFALLPRPVASPGVVLKLSLFCFGTQACAQITKSPLPVGFPWPWFYALYETKSEITQHPTAKRKKEELK